MSQLNLFDEQRKSGTQVLILNFGNKETMFALEMREQLRELQICTEIYPDAVKLKKQMAYADSRKIPYIVIAGEEEIVNNMVNLKIMSSGEQKKMTTDELLLFLKSELSL